MIRTLVALILTVGLSGAFVSSCSDDVEAASTPRHGYNYTDHEGQNATVDRQDQDIPPTKNGRPIMSVVFCGQFATTSTVSYNGPVEVQDGTGAGEGLNGPIDAGSTACDASDNTTEATASLPIFTNTPIYPLGMYCRAVAAAGTTGSGALGVELALRVADAAPATPLACRVETGQIDCATWYNLDSDLPTVAGGVPLSVRTTPGAEDLSANDGWCRLFFTF